MNIKRTIKPGAIKIIALIEESFIDFLEVFLIKKSNNKLVKWKYAKHTNIPINT